jgi:uncharacterized protein (DUF488 family)
MGPTIFTVGHGEQTLDDLFALLTDWAIEVLVDVRSYPSSKRNPQFNRNSLIGECSRYGIVYNWSEALGGKPRDRRLWLNEDTPDYYAMSQTPEFQAAIVALVEAAAEARIAIMCSESRPERCHRARLLQAPLIEEGATVKHLLPNGTLLEEELYTIGFAGKSLERFVTLLRDARVQRLIDVRLRPASQLSGYARQGDLRFVLEEYEHVEYRHSEDLAPTADILDGYRKSKDWYGYEKAFSVLMAQRSMTGILHSIGAGADRVALLCSEHEPERCHRRLLAERYVDEHGGTSLVHL